jgi:hypothetical protein
VIEIHGRHKGGRHCTEDVKKKRRLLKRNKGRLGAVTAKD